jgi:hypothetical protein
MGRRHHRHYALISSGIHQSDCSFGRTTDCSVNPPIKGWYLVHSAPEGKNITTYGSTRMEAARQMAELLRKRWYPNAIA